MIKNMLRTRKNRELFVFNTFIIFGMLIFCLVSPMPLHVALIAWFLIISIGYGIVLGMLCIFKWIERGER